MPYTKTTWADEVPASTPIKYSITGDIEGEISASAEIEIVTSDTAGTPVNASNLNKIETGIETAQAAAEAAIPKSLATAIGQLLYSTASAAWAVLSKPSADSVLKMTSAGTPSWKLLSEIVEKIITKRQGGNANDWNTHGTTNYTPAASAIMQCGAVQFAVTTLVGSVYTGNQTITFPIAYTYKPLIIVSVNYAASLSVVAIPDDVTATNFVLRIINSASAPSIGANWIALGV